MPKQVDKQEIALQGLWFEDFTPGLLIRSAGRTVTEADIVAFAGLSGDFNPIHVDEVLASRTAFRSRIAHGLLVQSLASGLVAQTGAFHGTIAALSGMNLNYTAPVRAGDTIRASLEVSDLDLSPSAKRGWVLFDARVVNQEDVVVIEGEWRTVMLRRRDA